MSEAFKRLQGAFAHSRDPEMDRNQRKEAMENKDLHRVDRDPAPCSRLRISRERLAEECLIDFSEKINNQPREQNQRQAGEENLPAIAQRAFQQISRADADSHVTQSH